ncbi:MAG: thioredoxin [Bacteroidales bacterium]
MALQFKDESVKELIASGKPVVIDFWAEWCGPCRMVSPIIDELSAEYEGRVAIGKYNVDEENDLSAEYGIRNIPTILFFKDGKLVDKQVGAAPKAAIQAKVDAIAE